MENCNLLMYELENHESKSGSMGDWSRLQLLFENTIDTYVHYLLTFNDYCAIFKV